MHINKTAIVLIALVAQAQATHLVTLNNATNCLITRDGNGKIITTAIVPAVDVYNFYYPDYKTLTFYTTIPAHRSAEAIIGDGNPFLLPRPYNDITLSLDPAKVRSDQSSSTFPTYANPDKTHYYLDNYFVAQVIYTGGWQAPLCNSTTPCVELDPAACSTS